MGQNRATRLLVKVADLIGGLNRKTNQHSGKIALLALGAAAVYNLRLWRRDEQLAQKVLAQKERIALPVPAPRVSVLVAAWNEGQRIEDHIRSFLNLSYPNIELILCAGGSDDTWKRALAMVIGQRITLLRQEPGEGKQKALARCLERATGDLIFLTDADCLYDDAALSALVGMISAENERVITGDSHPVGYQLDQVIPRHLWHAEVYASARMPGHIEGILGRNALIKREALVAAGGLAFDAPTGTDYHLARRLLASGERIRHTGASSVATAYPATLKAYWSAQSRWLRNLALYGGQYKAYHQVRLALRTSAIGFGMLVAPIIGLLGVRLALAGWIGLLAHTVLSRLRYAFFTQRIFKSNVPGLYILALIPLTITDFVLWVAPLLQLASAKSRKKW